MCSCEAIVSAARFLEKNGFTRRQLSSIHHFSLKGRDVSFAEAYRYFEEPKELKHRNRDYGERLKFIAQEYRAQRGRFPDLIARALEQWPLR